MAVTAAVGASTCDYPNQPTAVIQREFSFSFLLFLLSVESRGRKAGSLLPPSASPSDCCWSGGASSLSLAACVWACACALDVWRCLSCVRQSIQHFTTTPHNNTDNTSQQHNHTTQQHNTTNPLHSLPLRRRVVRDDRLPDAPVDPLPVPRPHQRHRPRRHLHHQRRRRQPRLLHRRRPGDRVGLPAAGDAVGAAGEVHDGGRMRLHRGPGAPDM